ncbi:acyltransferase, partial [Akkermansiaceae bacterium]|nr:acyltransferase [Akkermansiaceae bacterium]
MNRLSYRPDIDGLRAVAVLGVLFFHAGLGCKGGFVGVDVFFVISGFLITSLILRDLNAGTFSFADFWARRIRRIVPPLAVMTLVVIIVSYFSLFPRDLWFIGVHLLGLCFGVANISHWRSNDDYFSSDQEPLLHTWSLSVEEQFYVLIPIGLYLLYKVRGKNFVLPFGILLCGVSLAASIYSSYNKPTINFYFLPTRAWELGAGSLLAFARPITSSKSREILSLTGVALVISYFFCFREGIPFPGATALPPVIGAALFIWSGIGQTKLPIASRLLTLRPIVGIGLISYSLYLWHYP